MARLPDSSFHGIVTSPPYNLRNSSGNGLRDGRGGKWRRAALLKGYATHGDAMPHDHYVTWQRACLTEMIRLLQPDGAIFYNHTWRVQKGLLQDEQYIVAGFPVCQIIIWHRSGGMNFNPGCFLPNYEVIYLIAKPDFVLAPGAHGQGCVWRIGQQVDTRTRPLSRPDLSITVLPPLVMGWCLTPLSAVAQLVLWPRNAAWTG